IPGALTLAARSNGRAHIRTYVSCAIPILIALLLWQWMVMGSVFTTGYQTDGASVDGTGSLQSLFSPSYLLGPPWHIDGPNLSGAGREWQLPNLVAYTLQLA